MNVSQADACATSHSGVAWHSINWAKSHRMVRRLQARIVKATRESKWGKVKALQHLLTHSLSAKAIAVRRVTENRGKATPGVDGQTWSCPKEKSKAITLLKRRGYRPMPLRRIYIPKANGKLRPLGIPTMKDRAMQALYLLALEPVAETIADPNSYGFRPGRSTADAREQLHTLLAQKRAAQWIVEGDIKGCFDNISHDWMLTHIPMDKVILRKWLKSGYMEKGIYHDTEAGTPQGGIISPVLANMVLDGLETYLLENFPKPIFYSCVVESHYPRHSQKPWHHARALPDQGQGHGGLFFYPLAFSWFVELPALFWLPAPSVAEPRQLPGRPCRSSPSSRFEAGSAFRLGPLPSAPSRPGP
jgi:RNA-directed DNA polymerase